MTLTPLAVSALALLEERPMHPYEMLQLLRERSRAAVQSVKVGSLYHTMSRLADLNLAQVRSTERDGNRPERTVYGLTEQGRAAYIAWVRAHLSQPATAECFAVALSEAHNLDPGEVAAILAGRRAELAASATLLRDGLAVAQQRGVPEAYLIELDRRLALLDADLAWLARAQRRLLDGEITWPLGSTRRPPKATPLKEATPLEETTRRTTA